MSRLHRAQTRSLPSRRRVSAGGLVPSLAVAACVLCLMSCGGGGGGGGGVPGVSKARVWHQGIQLVSINMRGSAVVLAQQDITVGEPGVVLVQFDGNCVSSDGDRIILAASDVPDWSVNDGATAVEAYDSDVNRHSFSHSRSYAVAAGSHSFYAVGENFIETAGTGIASVYGSLTVKFFPDAGAAFVQHAGIAMTSVDVSAGVVTLGQQTINAPAAGEVLVRVDGLCVSSVGDLIVIAASDVEDWTVNDGNVGTEAIDSDKNTRVFCHSRRYAVGPGLNTFYAVAQQFVETAGSGIASFYCSLTVEYFPLTGGDATLDHVGVSQTSIDVEGAPVVMGQVTINAPGSGLAVVRYEGLCASSVGDRIVMAASDTMDWSTNDGNVNCEAVSADYNYNCFSHTRAYPVTAGSNTFYGVCENFVELTGNGIASNYASLSVEFFPDP